jgi:hypothetical protein
VLFGGLGYRHAARELAVSAPQAAALLRAALTRLPSQPVAAAVSTASGPPSARPGQAG